MTSRSGNGNRTPTRTRTRIPNSQHTTTRRLLVLLFVQALLPHIAKADGVQTSFGDISFAGSMTWEPLQDLLYLTGQVGNNGCWVGILQRQTMKFLSKVVLPEPAVCQTLLVPSQSDKTALLLGTTEEGGLFTNTRVTGSKKATQYGLLLPIQWQDAQASAAKLPTGLLLHEDPVQYPLSILQDPQRRDLVFVASLHSASNTLTDDFRQATEGTSTTTTPNLTPSGLVKYGSQFFLHIERIQYNLMGDKQLTATWRKPFGLGPTDVSEKYSVYLANMIWNRGTLVIAGSTRGGGGLIYGDQQPQAGNVTSYTHAYCMNGFISKLDPTTGQPWKSTKGTQRYSLGSDKDTFIEAICSSGDDATEIYIAGRYVVLSGNSAKSIAYLAKLDATSLEKIWHHDLVFSQNAFGLACGVGTDGVYMAGIVEAGGSYGAGGETTSLGKDDIFVVKVQITDGHSDWIRQIGTQGQDRLAHGGNGLLVVNDGIVLFGDTTGDLRATNHKGTEIFVVEMDSKGTVSWTTTETSGNENNGGSIQIQVAKRMDNGNANGSDNNGRPLTPTNSNEDQESITEKGGTGRGIGMIVAMFLLILVFFIGYLIRRSRTREVVTERAVVFSYLHAFDLEDVDVRHSATGGWHGTYVGNLALGKGQGTVMSPSGGASRLSHSSIVKDSLFLDYEPTTKASSSPYGDDYKRNFRIGYDGEHDSDDEDIGNDDDDPDFEAIGRLEDQLSKQQQQQGENDSKTPWGRDII